MPDNIPVTPSNDASAVVVATDVVNIDGVDVHVPMYKQVHGPNGQIAELNVTKSNDLLSEILRQLKIANIHLSELSEVKVGAQDDY